MPACAQCKFSVEDWMSVCPRCRTPVPRPAKEEREKDLSKLGTNVFQYPSAPSYPTPPGAAVPTFGPPPRVAPTKGAPKPAPPPEPWEIPKSTGPAILWALVVGGVAIIATAVVSATQPGMRYRWPMNTQGGAGLYLFLGALLTGVLLIFLQGIGQRLATLYGFSLLVFLFLHLAAEGHSVRFAIHLVFLASLLVLVLGNVSTGRIRWFVFLFLLGCGLAYTYEYFRARRHRVPFEQAKKYCAMERIDDAMDHINDVIGGADLWEIENPTRAYAWYSKGLLFKKKGLHDDARKMFQEAAPLDPGNTLLKETEVDMRRSEFPWSDEIGRFLRARAAGDAAAEAPPGP